MKTTYLISYDISNNKTRGRVASLLKDFGLRWQLSVFLCLLSKREMKVLRQKIEELVTQKKDSILYIPLYQDTLKKIMVVGGKNLVEDRSSVHFMM